MKWVSQSAIVIFNRFYTLSLNINNGIRLMKSPNSNNVLWFKTHIRVIYEKTVEEPKGWIDIPIRNDFGNPIHTWMIQIVIKQNHQSGRDSHLRQGFGHNQTFCLDLLIKKIGKLDPVISKLNRNNFEISHKDLSVSKMIGLLTNKKSVFLVRNQVPKI